MSELKCPHCDRELYRVWYGIVDGWEEWNISAYDKLVFDVCDVTETEGPFCLECNAEVRKYLEKMGIRLESGSSEGSKS